MKVTEEHIDNQVDGAVYYRFPNTTVTVCCLTLKNGYNVIGESACADPTEFNEIIGQKLAFENARGKVWELEGYLLRERLDQGIMLQRAQGNEG